MAEFRRARAIMQSPLPALMGLGAIMLAERVASLRPRTQREPARSLRNLTLGALSLLVVSTVEGPVARSLARRAVRRRRGLVQRLPLPPPARDALAFLALDYTMYVWHVLTHKVPLLWRLHLVHHVDLDLDATTALRFHAADMLLSVPWRAAQVALLGVSPRALRIWQGFFFASIVFHHSNLRLPGRVESVLARVLTTPRMHGIHHTAEQRLTNSNWSSGLSFWDRLHGSFRLTAPPGVRIGVPAYHHPRQTGLLASLLLPFLRQRNDWRTRR